MNPTNPTYRTLAKEHFNDFKNTSIFEEVKSLITEKEAIDSISNFYKELGRVELHWLRRKEQFPFHMKFIHFLLKYSQEEDTIEHILVHLRMLMDDYSLQKTYYLLTPSLSSFRAEYERVSMIANSIRNDQPESTNVVWKNYQINTIEDIRDIFIEEGISEFWTFLREHIKPEIRFEISDKIESILGQTKIGGFPDLPDHVDWPVDKINEPLSFLAQINCNQIATKFPDFSFPQKGMLYFFIPINKNFGVDKKKIDLSFG